MKKIITILIILLSTTGIKAQDKAATASLPQMADSAYNDLAYSEALNLYQATADSLGVSPDLLYNIGNTYYRLSQPGKAILYYERALRLDPAHKDARANLKFVNSTISDRPIDNRSLLKRRYDSFVNSASADTWAWTATAFFALAVVGVVVYLISSKVIFRKISFFGALIATVVAILFVIIAMTSARRSTSTSRAIILSPAAHLYNAPRASTDPADQAYLLHEGTAVTVVDSLIRSGDIADRWYEITLGEKDTRAWISGDDIEII